MEIVEENVNLSRLHVLTAVKKTLFHFNQEVIDQSFVKIVLGNKDRGNLGIFRRLGIPGVSEGRNISGIGPSVDGSGFLAP